MKRAVVLGAGGFIGGHLVTRLKKENYWVRGVDLKYPEFKQTDADEFVIGDLREKKICEQVIDNTIDEVFQLAADMGGAQYIFTGENDANIMHNSCQINLNVADVCVRTGVKKVFYSSSACIYPAYNQQDPDNPICSEDSAYPADPDSNYGFEKIFSERLYMAYHRNYGLNVRIARFHNIFGPNGTYFGGKEKAPAALCRKIIESKDGNIEIFGNGLQTRSFLYVDECIEGVMRLMESEYSQPINIGSAEMVTINQLAFMIMEIGDKKVNIVPIIGPTGVKGRCSDNKLIMKELNWAPSLSLRSGLEKTYKWIFEQIEQKTTT